MITVLTGYRNALHTDRGEGRHDATGGAVIGSDDCIDLIIVGGQYLLHVGLSDLGLPAVRVLIADDFDVAAVDGRLQNLELTTMQEIGIGIGLVALDEDIVALGHQFEDLPGLHSAYFDIIEGQVKYVRVLDQAVIADHRDALGLGLCNSGKHRRRVPGQNDQRIGAARD